MGFGAQVDVASQGYRHAATVEDRAVDNPESTTWVFRLLREWAPPPELHAKVESQIEWSQVPSVRALCCSESSGSVLTWALFRHKKTPCPINVTPPRITGITELCFPSWMITPPFIRVTSFVASHESFKAVRDTSIMIRVRTVARSVTLRSARTSSWTCTSRGRRHKDAVANKMAGEGRQ